jgi:hypothetical protein
VYVAGDVLVAAAGIYAASTAWSHNPQPPYVPLSEGTAGVFAASSLVGMYKRHNCVRWRETAPPEVWAEYAARHQQEAAALAQAQAEAQAACPEGTTATGNVCACPDGYLWDGNQCVDAATLQDQTQTPSTTPSPNVTVQNNSVHNTFINKTNNRTVNVVVTHPAPSNQVWQSPPPTPYHAAFQAAYGGAMTSCQAFGPDMGGCARYCTNLMEHRLKCNCSAGGCP